MVDVKTLERLAQRLKEDAQRGMGIQPSAAGSIAAIIEDAIGAPAMWPSRVAGMQYADDYYAGSPNLRLVFNHGVKWAVENYGPTVEIKMRGY